jgi:hypothetical protein
VLASSAFPPGETGLVCSPDAVGGDPGFVTRIDFNLGRRGKAAAFHVELYAAHLNWPRALGNAVANRFSPNCVTALVAGKTDRTR